MQFHPSKILELNKLNEVNAKSGKNILHYAAINNDINLLRIGLANNVDASRLDNQSRTSLYYALQLQRWELVSELMKRHAQLKADISEVRIYVNEAKGGNRKEIEEYLSKDNTMTNKLGLN